MSSFAITFAQATALQAASNRLLTEICELQTQVAAVQPLVQEFRVATAAAVSTAKSVPPRPANMANDIVASTSSCSSAGCGSSWSTTQIPQ
jgi:hypothetical protein